MRKTLKVGDWVETGWSLAVDRSGYRFNILRIRAIRPDLTINLLVPPLSRAVLSIQRSHLIVGRSY